MGTPGEDLRVALRAWLVDEARETVARWRDSPGAASRAEVVARHRDLFGPRGRDLFDEATERGELAGDERAAVAAWLRDGLAGPGRDRADDRLRELAAQPVAHDSDFHAATKLLARAATDADRRRRLAIARDLDGFFATLAAAIRSGLADVEEAADRGAWLGDVPAPPDGESVAADEASALLDRTADAWDELAERLAHAGGTELEHWTDLARALRAPGLDDRFDPARRWRRLAAHLRPLGLEEPLSKRARAEPSSGWLGRPGGDLAAIDVPRDVRVSGGVELGLAAERDATITLGRALAVASTSPAIPSALARPRAGTVGRAIGGLLAHLHADPVFAERALSLRGTDARAVREVALGLELAALRTGAARASLTGAVGSAAFADQARETLRAAWRVDPGPSLAAALALPRGPFPDAAFRAARFVPALHVALRERFDEDWWRNPRAAEVLRAAMARGGTLSVEAWAEELGATAETTADTTRERVAELLG